jgi:carbamoyltransferase
MITWGISANSHDAALAVFYHRPWANNSMELLFASHSERYSGIKNDAHLNDKLISEAKKYGEPDEIIWYERPFVKTLRQLRAGQGFKYLGKNNISKYLRSYGIRAPIRYIDHHLAHAAAGFYTSRFTEASIVVVDSIGEFDTLTIWNADQEKGLRRIYSQQYPHSIGLWYSAFTQRIGLKPQEDEYILMGMAAYGDPMRFMNEILEEFFELPDEESLLHIFNDKPRIKLKHNLHRGCLWWRPELNKPQDIMDIAAAVQAIYCYLLKIISNWARWKSPSGNLVLMGGCALNCAANSKIRSDWNDAWIMPNPGDAGSSIGAVLAHKKEFMPMPHVYTGYNIEGDYPVEEVLNELLTTGICGVANGRAEFGPRAFGHRSLLADPRGEDIKDRVNNIKKRQLFRPFAPAVLEEHAATYFDGYTNPFMQYTSTCKDPGLPAITHGDGTSRVQTISSVQSVGFRKLLERWYEETGCPVLLNTSLNIKGKPIVNTEQDAKEFAEYYGVKVCTAAVKT